MGLVASDLSRGYAPRHMAARVSGTGPWGAAIRYWLPRKNMLQADLMRATGLRKNTISRATRGLDVNTTTLEKIAEAFHEPIELVLVSPEWMDHAETRRQLIQEAVENALRNSPYGTRREHPTMSEALAEADQAVQQEERARRTPSAKPKAHKRPVGNQKK